MKCRGKPDTSWTIPRSITFSPLHFMLYRGKSIIFGTVRTWNRFHYCYRPFFVSETCKSSKWKNVSKVHFSFKKWKSKKSDLANFSWFQSLLFFLITDPWQLWWWDQSWPPPEVLPFTSTRYYITIIILSFKKIIYLQKDCNFRHLAVP